MAAKAGVARPAELLRPELHGKGVGVLTVHPGATSTPMTGSSQAGTDFGCDYERVDRVAAGVLTGIAEGQVSLHRGGAQRTVMIGADHQDSAGAGHETRRP